MSGFSFATLFSQVVIVRLDKPNAVGGVLTMQIQSRLTTGSAMSADNIVGKHEKPRAP